MYWYLRKFEDSPLAVMQRMHQADLSGDIEKIDQKKLHEDAKMMMAWEQARGRNTYQPIKKTKAGKPGIYYYFLQFYKIKGISGGNRSSKTATHCIDITMQCEGWHPLQRENLEKLYKDALDEWVREHCGRLLDERKWIKSPPVAARCVAVDFTSGVEKFCGPEYEKWLTLAECKEISYSNDKKRRIVWKNKSFVEFMTTEQDLDAHGGVARDSVMVDEECPYDYWVESCLMRTLSTRGRILYGATAVQGVSWSEEEIWLKGDQGHPNIYTMELSTYDNPVNSEEEINTVLSLCKTQADIDIRIFGKRVRRGGNVYDMAQDEFPWIIPKFEIPKEDGVLILAIDPHPKVEHALLWVWVDYEGNVEIDVDYKTFGLIDDKPNLYECAEVFQHGTIPQLAFYIRQMESRIGRKHDFCLCDPAAWIDDQKTTTKTMEQQLVDAGIFPIKGSKDKRGGILKVKELLSIIEYADKDNKIIEKVLDHPRLMMMEDMNRVTPDMIERARWERKNYHWKRRKGKLAEEMSIPQDPVDKDDHQPENERRICEFVIEYEYDLID
jgi:hypothetical protein